MQALNLDRRRFLKQSVALGAGLSLAFYLPNNIAQTLQRTPPAKPFQPNAFLRIGSDHRVTVIVKHLEMGQGVFTGLPTLVAEELDADWSQVMVEAAPANAKLYKNLKWGAPQGTGESNAIANAFMQMRLAGATARAMLVNAAALQWQVPASEISVVQGRVMHVASARSVGFGDLVNLAQTLEVPDNVPLKAPKDFRVIGQSLPRKDALEKVTGQAKYTIDMQLPGMLTALVAHPPSFGAQVRSFDATNAKAIQGVVEVVQIPAGVAVVAESFWAAKLGRDALKVTWDTSQSTAESSLAILARFKALAAKAGAVVRSNGDVTQALATARHTITVAFEYPYLAHAPMEPMDCTIALTDSACTLWHGEQMQTFAQVNLSKALGIPATQIQIHPLYAGGSFGRRGNPRSDYQLEAAHIAKACNTQAPIKLVWTREDELRAGYFRPFNYHVLTAGLDRHGQIIAWHHRIVGQSILSGTMIEGVMLEHGLDPMSTQGAHDLPYQIPHLLVDLHSPSVNVPVLWWRSVGHSHTAFSIETLMDELAHLLKQDPAAFRRAHLATAPRLLQVLNLAVERSSWDQPLPSGQGRGLALHRSFDTYVAQVAEVTVSRDGEVKVVHVTCVVDCGIAVNPNIITAQMQSGIGFGLSAALRGEITIEEGQVQQTNFHQYTPIRMHEMPSVTVHIVPSDAPPSGVGEPGVPPIAPAVCNAIFMATGKRIRSLPISKHDLRY